jgi:hypothetical protein
VSDLFYFCCAVLLLFLNFDIGPTSMMPLISHVSAVQKREDNLVTSLVSHQRALVKTAVLVRLQFTGQLKEAICRFWSFMWLGARTCMLKTSE